MAHGVIDTSSTYQDFTECAAVSFIFVVNIC